jgi:histone H3/H4
MAQQFVSPANLSMAFQRQSQSHGATEISISEDGDIGQSPRQTTQAGTPVTQFPVSRIKRIIKEDLNVDKIANDAVMAVTLATEAFVEYVLQHAHQYTKREKRKVVMYRDLGTTL